MKHAFLIAFALCAACEPPPMALRFALTDGDSQHCTGDTGIETTSCADVTMSCDGVLSVRIVPPNAPEFPYISVCEHITGGPRKSLCSIAGVDLPTPLMPIPEQILEVQMAMFSAKMLDEMGYRDADGNFICPPVDFAANHLPVMAACSSPDPTQCTPRPAVGGRTYYYPGDSKTVVELGCTELGLLKEMACTSEDSIDVFTTVNDFDSGTGVTTVVASRLTVSIGEPQQTDGLYSLTNKTELLATGTMPPAWNGTIVDDVPIASYCLEVFEDVPQTTGTLVCRQVVPDLARIDIAGVLLSRASLTQILTALGRTQFPDKGLVVGVVLNQFNSPVSGAVVNASCGSGCTLKYLSADRTTITTNATSTNGIFISEDAPYGSLFSRSGVVQQTFGGLVEGKVTIVIIQESGIGNP